MSNRRFYAENRERQCTKAREWRSQNPERVAETSKLWREENAERRAELHRNWRAADPERTKARRKASYEQRKEAELARARAYKAARKEELREKNAAYWKANPEVNNFHRSRRRAREMQATPPWADPEKMRAVYAEAARISRETDIPHEVDHIVPLKSDLVCGLHCEANLQILTAEKNRSKRNRHWPDMPD